jgi:hypothetical protein
LCTSFRFQVFMRGGKKVVGVFVPFSCAFTEQQRWHRLAITHSRPGQATESCREQLHRVRAKTGEISGDKILPGPGAVAPCPSYTSTMRSACSAARCGQLVKAAVEVTHERAGRWLVATLQDAGACRGDNGVGVLA